MKPEYHARTQKCLWRPGRSGLRTRWFYAFFFISGFCSLIYEVVWLRLSMANFGVTTVTVTSTASATPMVGPAG